MYKLVFFVPDSHLESVKTAVFAAGAGRQGDYEQCCWQTLGRGQFRPSEQADPFIGTKGKLEQLDEWRVEMLCDPQQLGGIVEALKTAHPYEEVAFDLTQLLDPDQLPI